MTGLDDTALCYNSCAKKYVKRLLLTMRRPDFDSIKTYEEFKKYKWYRDELVKICKAHGLLFVGTEKKLNKVIEAYFNGEKIPPRRNWYTNMVLNSFVNENGVMMLFTLGLFAVSLVFTVIGIINRIRDLDDLNYVPHFVFGITGLIFSVIGIQTDKDWEVIKSFFPVCGDKRFTRAQVDEQVNSEKTELLKGTDVFLAPDMLVGVSSGVAAIAYEDIKSLQVRQTWHTKRIGSKYSGHYEDYYTYRIVVRTNKFKWITLSNGTCDAENEAKIIHNQCLMHNPNVKYIEMKKSVFAPDDSAKQVIFDKGVKNYVNRAVQNQFLTPVTVDEEIKKKFTAFHIRKALILIPESLLVALIAAAIMYLCIVIFHRAVIGMFLFAWLLFPFYAVYDLFAVLRSVKKDDTSFYAGVVVHNDDKGYVIKGLDFNRFGYIKKLKPDRDPGIGDTVIIARFRDGFSLISDNKKDA